MNTVVLEVRPLGAVLDDAAHRMRTDDVASTAARIAFATPELLWRVLTAKRIGRAHV